MESTNLRIENWERSEVEEISYSISLKIPPKDELLRLLPNHLSSLHYSWKCHTGILSKAEHSLKLCLYREYHEPKVGLYVSIINNSTQNSISTIINDQEVLGASETSPRIMEIRGIDMTYMTSASESGTGGTVEDSMSKVDPPKPMQINGMDFWQSTCGWPDHTKMLYLILHVVKRKPPKIVIEDTDNPLVPRDIPNFSYNGLIDIKNYFLSPECSDLTVQCGHTTFPAHQIILCSRSTYFSTMFASSMKETKERLILIDDLTPPIVKELLRFIYLGEVSDLHNNAKDLFISADKYGMDDLKSLCEANLAQNLKVENAIEIYDLCQMHGSQLLVKKAKEIILWNKGRIAPDPETLKAFTCKYPELVFELFRFES